MSLKRGVLRRCGESVLDGLVSASWHLPDVVTIAAALIPSQKRTPDGNSIALFYCVGIEHEHFRTCRRVLKASVGQADFRFPVVVGSSARNLASEAVGLSRLASPGAGRAFAAIRPTDS